MSALTDKKSWKNLEEHRKLIENRTISSAFDEDSERFSKFSITFDDFLIDYSKNRLNNKTLTLLFDLAKECELEQEIKKMFSGLKINSTENRAVLHTALRNRSNKSVLFEGKDVMPQVNEVLAKMKNFCGLIHSGQW